MTDEAARTIIDEITEELKLAVHRMSNLLDQHKLTPEVRAALIDAKHKIECEYDNVEDKVCEWEEATAAA